MEIVLPRVKYAHEIVVHTEELCYRSVPLEHVPGAGSKISRVFPQVAQARNMTIGVVA